MRSMDSNDTQQNNSKKSSTDASDPSSMELVSQDRRVGPRMRSTEARIDDLRIIFSKVVWDRIGRPARLEVRKRAGTSLWLIPSNHKSNTRRVEQHGLQCRVYLGRATSLGIPLGLYHAEPLLADGVTALVVHMDLPRHAITTQPKGTT
jgi:hypothetical protein